VAVVSIATQAPDRDQQIKLRGCDIATVENYLITERRLCFDQTQFSEPLGLLPEPPS
jgi:hypothetical protein